MKQRKQKSNNQQITDYTKIKSLDDIKNFKFTETENNS